MPACKDNPGVPAVGVEVKIFDPRDPAMGMAGAEVTDASVVERNGQWWMFLAGQAAGYGPTDLFSASLPAGAALGATGWKLTSGLHGQPAPLAGRSQSGVWDGQGGRHCPSYVRGWDPQKGAWAERIYYAGAAESLAGPYAIGFLEWDGERWVDQPEPVLTAQADWEKGSVCEPNLVYHDGLWRMWYAAVANHLGYVAHGYAESQDGCNWKRHVLFAPPEMTMFDFCVRERNGGFDAIFSRVWLFREGAPPPETGLWWCRADTPSGTLADWSRPVQILTAEDRGWHAGPFKPCLQFVSREDERGFVFFDGLYRTSDPGPFPFALTLGCLPIHLPAHPVATEPPRL